MKKNYQIGNTVNVESKDNLPKHSFSGVIVEIYPDYATVKDSEDNHFDVEYSQLTNEVSA